MESRLVHAPVPWLLDPGQTASMKVLAMARRLHPTAIPAELELHTGLSRHTILTGLSTLKAPRGAPGVQRVKVPGALLAEAAVGAQAKVLYGLLQATPDIRGWAGTITYAALSELTGLSRNTLRRAIAQLTGAGWIQVSQANRHRPIHFTLGSPQLHRAQAEAADARQRLRRAKFGGEALMQEYLSLLIDSDAFTDNARPGFLVNPQTGERLELDRYYPPGVAFEFNGAQHYGATDRVSREEADAQYLRDLIKAGICLYRGVHLVIIHAEDLSLQTMTRKIGGDLPLRSLAGREPLIELLEEASLTYRASTHPQDGIGAAHQAPLTARGTRLPSRSSSWAASRPDP